MPPEAELCHLRPKAKRPSPQTNVYIACLERLHQCIASLASIRQRRNQIIPGTYMTGTVNMGLARFSPPRAQSPVRPSPGFSRTHGCIALGACGMMVCWISFGWRCLSVRLCLSVSFLLASLSISFLSFSFLWSMTWLAPTYDRTRESA